MACASLRFPFANAIDPKYLPIFRATRTRDTSSQPNVSVFVFCVFPQYVGARQQRQTHEEVVKRTRSQQRQTGIEFSMYVGFVCA